MPQIRVGLNQGLVVPLENREIVIGRDPSSDLPLSLIAASWNPAAERP